MNVAPPLSNILPLHRKDGDDAVQVVFTWLEGRHRKAWQIAMRELLEAWLPRGDVDLRSLDDDVAGMLSINAPEWLLSAGQLDTKRGPRDINSLLLSRDGPYLTPAQTAWIAQLGERPLRLYRVTDVRVGDGLTLVDELNPELAPVRVVERTGSRTAKAGMLMAARVVDLGSGDNMTPVLSGALYPYSTLHEAAVVAGVRQVLADAQAAKLHASNVRHLVEHEIARAWLAQWLTPPPRPQILDASTGQPMLLVTDHYRVQDAAALAAALAAQADVSGDAQSGWNRVLTSEDGTQRSRATINPGRTPERIEVFYRTQALADEGRAWFDALAGATVAHLTREIADPSTHAGRAQHGAGGPTPSAPSSGEPVLSSEQMRQLMEQLIHRTYAHWCEEALPALNGLSPRQAIATPAGLERVKGLLRMYEDGERRMSTEQGRPAVSYQFLWDALALSR